MIFAVFFCGCTAQSGFDKHSAAQTRGVSEQDALLIYRDAGMKTPMGNSGAVFKEKTDIPLTYNYAGSGQLLSQMKLTEKGNIYMLCATTNFENAKKKGFIQDEALVAYHEPVIATPKRNPANITSLENMAKTGVEGSMGEPDSMALGIIAKKIFNKS